MILGTEQCFLQPVIRGRMALILLAEDIKRYFAADVQRMVEEPLSCKTSLMCMAGD